MRHFIKQFWQRQVDNWCVCAAMQAASILLSFLCLLVAVLLFQVLLRSLDFQQSPLERACFCFTGNIGTAFLAPVARIGCAGYPNVVPGLVASESDTSVLAVIDSIVGKSAIRTALGTSCEP